MSGIARFAVLAATLLSLSGALSSGAGAVTWHNVGDTSFTAHGGAAGLSVTGASLACTSGDASGTAPGGSYVGNTYTALTLNVGLTGCTLLNAPATVSCGYAFTTNSLEADDSYTGTLDVLCNVSLFGTEVCKIEGMTPALYKNAGSFFDGVLTVGHSDFLRTTHGAGGTCPLAPGEPATLTAQTWGLDGTLGGDGPTIVRTA